MEKCCAARTATSQTAILYLCEDFAVKSSVHFFCCVSQDGLVINHHADHTLNSFCHWQSTLGGREGRHHDHAILLTGLDICSWKNEPCDTLGMTYLLFIAGVLKNGKKNWQGKCGRKKTISFYRRHKLHLT